MAEIHFKAFLSCSFAEEDRDIIDFFKKIIQSFNITPLVYDYQEIGRLTDKVKENIIQSDCLIAILTRKNKIEGKVILKVFINKSGSVSEAVILQGIPELNNAAKNAAMQYKFKPAELNGEPVDVWFPLGITFKL